MTPSELTKVAGQIADLLARESNAGLTAEELAMEIASSAVEVYEEIQAKSYNLVIVSSFRLADGEVHTAAVGPLSSRAPQRAREMGRRFAWDYRTRTGEGKYTLVPLVRDPRDAWDEARNAGLAEYEHHLSSITPGVDPTYEPMRLDLPDETRAHITAEWQMDSEILKRRFGPHCLCGRYQFAETTHLGHPVTKGCPLHLEGGPT